MRARVAPIIVLALAACVGERERLDVPRLTLRIDDTAAAAGAPITGRVEAADASGLIFLGVYACTRDSTYRRRQDFIRADSAAFPFELRVAGVTPANAPVRVYAVAIDNQNFSADTSHMLYVRDGTPPGDSVDSGAGLCGVAP
jgi:hypothetical protein